MQASRLVARVQVNELKVTRPAAASPGDGSISEGSKALAVELGYF